MTCKLTEIIVICTTQYHMYIAHIHMYYASCGYTQLRYLSHLCRYTCDNIIVRCTEYSYSVSLPMSQFGSRENVMIYSRLYILRVDVDPYRFSCKQCRRIPVLYYKSTYKYRYTCTLWVCIQYVVGRYMKKKI